MQDIGEIKRDMSVLRDTLQSHMLEDAKTAGRIENIESLLREMKPQVTTLRRERDKGTSFIAGAKWVAGLSLAAAAAAFHYRTEIIAFLAHIGS